MEISLGSSGAGGTWKFGAKVTRICLKGDFRSMRKIGAQSFTCLLPRQKVKLVHPEYQTRFYHLASFLWDPGNVTRYLTMQKVKKQNQNAVKASQIRGANFIIFL